MLLFLLKDNDYLNAIIHFVLYTTCHLGLFKDVDFIFTFKYRRIIYEVNIKV